MLYYSSIKRTEGNEDNMIWGAIFALKQCCGAMCNA